MKRLGALLVVFVVLLTSCNSQAAQPTPDLDAIAVAISATQSAFTPTPPPTLTSSRPQPLDVVWEVAIEYAPGIFGGNVYANPAANTIYISRRVTAGTSAIWRSMDWGKWWESLRVGSVLFDGDDSNILKEGRIEVASLTESFPIYTWYSGNIMKSLRGRTLAKELGLLNLDATRRALNKIYMTPLYQIFPHVVAYDPVKPGLILIGGGIRDTSLGRDQWEFVPVLFFSSDGGRTWRRVEAPSHESWTIWSSFSALGIVQDAKGDVHLFAGINRMWHAVLSEQ